MGRMIMVKCDCGFFKEDYLYGVNMAYPRVKKHQTALAKSGYYGKQWQELLSNDPELLVNAEYRLYQCSGCNKLISEYCMDLYKSSREDGYYYTPESNEVIYQYKHICPDCKKRMVHIPISQKHFLYGADNFEELVLCPNCGNTVIAKLSGFTD